MTLRVYHTQVRKLEKLARKESDPGTLTRYRVIIGRARGQSYVTLQRVLGVAPATIVRLQQRFAKEGIDGLRDRRREQAPRKITEDYLLRLEELVWSSPRKYGWNRSTWTRELLASQLCRDTGIRCHETHVGRLLQEMGMRWGRPRPCVSAWRNTAAKRRRAAEIQRLAATLPAGEELFYEDEMDLHLNPKIGPCWMPKGRQFNVETPGNNQKRYVFGGLNSRTGNLCWLITDKKNSDGFIAWLRLLSSRYRKARRIHVVLDNYAIHKTHDVKRTLAELPRIVLHFLPPYSPELNPIERLWGELHANVTRNHDCTTMRELEQRVEGFMHTATPYPGSRPSLAMAA